ncbi:hypothetical protein SUNI508_07940 [Seiridium unicorne]|uniref:Uncharacterized protein n=1 Tax=Seiridium unicorne TaxID=138068 RepID=A0ABR2UVJ0_9PEZI
MSRYIVSISNKSGSKQSYAVFAALPQIQANNQAVTTIHRRIITSVHSVPTGDGQANIFLPKAWYATCGTYDVDTETATRQVTAAVKNRKVVSSGTEIVDQREVELGSLTDTGLQLPGSTLVIECSDGTPCFATSDQTIPRAGALDHFAIRTLTDFTAQEAKANKYLVGFTSSLRPNIGPYASFVPQPGKLYQIKPSSALYVVVGHYHSRDLVAAGLQDEDTTYKIDFEKMATDHIHLAHRADGMLTMIKTEVELNAKTNTVSTPTSPILSPTPDSPGTISRL